MLYYNFGNYEGFKERFGIVRDENGKLLRKNKILLSFVKNKKLFKYSISYCNNGGSIRCCLINAQNLSIIENHIRDFLLLYRDKYTVNIMDNRFYSPIYATDELNGMPEDGSMGFVRYKNMERGGKVYKMKIGKMIRHLMDSMYHSEIFSEEAKNYFCEVMTEEWMSYQGRMIPHGEVVVDRDFGYIYNSDNYAGEISSCMSDKGFHTFYDLVDAHAASLRNKEGKILSRCIIFDEVHVGYTSEILRLAERQYSVDDNLVYSRILIDKLIEGGYIDGYKKIGAGCHDARAFVRNDGEPIDGMLYISTSLDADDVVSYQDSFKYYESGTLYNIGIGFYFSLESTDGEIGGTNYDEYHQCRTFNGVLQCHYDGSWIDVDEERLHDFVLVGNDYYHCDEVSKCAECGEYFLENHGFYSNITEEFYCTEQCLHEAEDEYIEEHDAQDDYTWFDDRYYPSSEIGICPECGSAFLIKEGCYSHDTEEDYCCYNCLLDAKSRYEEGHEKEKAA